MGVIGEITIGSIYLILLIGYFIWLRKKNKSRKSLWLFSGAYFLLYLVLVEILNHSFYLIIPVLFFGLFYYFYQRDKPRLRNGWLFTLFLVVFATYLVAISFLGQSYITIGLLGILGIIFLFVLLFGLYALIIFLIGNSYIVLKKESHSIANLLTLILAVALIAWLVIQQIGPEILPQWSLILLSIPSTILVYFFLIFWNFLLISLIYQLNQPKFNQDYLIVLGAGLIDGEKVSPILASRINRGIAFYHQQFAKAKRTPILLMSGGKGSDEKISEAEAMKNYAVEQGIPSEDILLEATSTNTYENMLFSKKLMDRLTPAGYQVIFTSNNFHIFRGAMFADQVGLKADGIGAKTAKYYLPNAFLREFAAIILMNKRRHLIVCAVIVLLFFLISMLNLIFT